MNKHLKKFVFVLMPFDESFNDIYNYGIKQTCTDLDSYCERVDEQIFNERILDRIYNQISKADIVIADMTMRNPNVFYEVGYTHGIGKNVILLTQNADDIPFDLKHFPHIIYNGKIKNLAEQLKKKLEWFLNDENAEIVQDIDFNLDFLIDGIKIVENAIIPISKRETWSSVHSIKLDIYNDSQKIYKTKFKIGLEFSKDYDFLLNDLEKIKPSQDKVLFVSKELFNIYPHAYKSIDFGLAFPSSKSEENLVIDCKLKIFTIFELREIDFKLDVNPDFKIDIDF